ncbi:hypothetical protein, partial [Parvimonas sp. M20]|uniref:hypothetical protein n=1 Tax=Parvimonas sp. M20 TaxID=3110693 RepID=UPI002B4687F8
TEAWLDKDMIDAIGGDATETYQRVLDGEMVDVSVGAFIDIVEGAGIHNGKNYAGSWANVVPDHLAFLSAGVQGACTVEAGCGAPRINAGSTVFSGMRQVKPVACCEACAHGDQHCEGTDMSKATITVNTGDANGVDITGDLVIGG